MARQAANSGKLSRGALPQPRIGEHLTALLTEQGLRHRDLARALDTNERQIVRWTSNQTAPRPGTRQRIADVLGVSSADLLDDEQVAA